VTIVMLALCMVALIAIAGLAIDGGAAYSQRGQQQNSADSAALAGTSQVYQELYKGDTSPAGTILSVVQTEASNNGGAVDATECRIIDVSENDLGACPSPGGSQESTVLPPGALGVSVTSRHSSNTTFMQAVGIDTYANSAVAAARVEAVTALPGGASPFMICAVGTSDPRNGGDGQDPPILLQGTDTINPAAVNHVYNIHGGGVANCGMPNESPDNSWNGLTEGSNYPIPGWWAGKNGDQGAKVNKEVFAGGCSGSSFTRCLMLVPLCYNVTSPPPPSLLALDPNGNPDGELYCVGYGLFRITEGQDSAQLVSRFARGIVVSGGQGGGAPIPDAAVAIKLVQ
jgi:Flp pilus assembly protein TadG